MQRLSLVKGTAGQTGDGRRFCDYGQTAGIATRVFVLPDETPDQLGKTLNDDEHKVTSQEVSVGTTRAALFRSTQTAGGHHNCVIVPWVAPRGLVMFTDTDFRGDDVSFDELCEHTRRTAEEALPAIVT